MQIALKISYDGTNYGGWQRQINAITIQQKIEEALSEIFKTKITVSGASRTDAGVSAIWQIASFFIESCKIPIEKFPYVINSFLPEDIAVTSAYLVPDIFHPRFCAIEKTYRYQIWNNSFPNPLLRRTTAFFPYKLDVELMKLAAVQIIGCYDFAAFCASGSQVKTTIREVYDCRLESKDFLLTFYVRGNGFLYNMVRIIVGTLLYIGQGKIKANSISDIIASKDRTKAGKTAPPNGLTLWEIRYDQKFDDYMNQSTNPVFSKQCEL